MSLVHRDDDIFPETVSTVSKLTSHWSLKFNVSSNLAKGIRTKWQFIIQPCHWHVLRVSESCRIKPTVTAELLTKCKDQMMYFISIFLVADHYLICVIRRSQLDHETLLELLDCVFYMLRGRRTVHLLLNHRAARTAYQPSCISKQQHWYVKGMYLLIW